MRKLVLASTSPYRSQLLQQLQLPFVTAAPFFKEELQQGVAPELLVKHLSYHKAFSLRERFPDALIIGSDQVFVDPRGRIHGKPHTQEKAVEQLTAMAGNCHRFYTGICVYDSFSGEAVTDHATFQVTLRKLGPEQIRSYVRRENPVDCAGAFKIEGLGIALMEKMEGDDFHSLVGLPLIKLCDILEKFGVELL
ncbi:MAG TPA: nucleoside triphosphate pyrophosphatase [Desulfuromonadales bacterium]|nr:nucleoside triphosphate pyrophosphatase [Desulfuromonadales bacterium]